MKKIFVWAIVLPFFTFGQTKDSIVNPKHNWYFGIEAGKNIIESYAYNEPKQFFQAGLLAEYYFAKQWSLTGRIKYFKIGESRGVINNTYNNTVDLKGYKRFDGEVIAIPINIKWEFRIIKNFKGFLKTGFVLNQEIESNYYYPPNDKIDYSTFYGDANFGFGFTYFFSKKIAIYLENEVKGFDHHRGRSNYLLPEASNSFWNIGVKYNFKK